MTPLDPEPTYLFSGARRHIARPDHPRGWVPTNIAFCGAVATPTSTADEAPTDPTDTRPACKRCSLAWVAYIDRLNMEQEAKG